ncbi:hypothetical protein AWN76_003665 [Rhodothermaceae bacterium RA]|nr:hypothetical protein AWN76_003665 [Rhodothermaceae bacterium RA]
MATIRFLLRKDKTRSDGTAPVYLRVTSRRRSRHLSTGIRIEPRFWNDARQEVRRSHPLSDAYNARLADLRLEAERAALEAGARRAAPEAVIQQLDGTGTSFYRFLDAFIDDLERKGRVWSWKRYRVLRGKLEACFGPRLDWGDLDGKALVRLERYLTDRLGNGANTVRKELAMLHRVVRQAIRDGEVGADRDPFLRYDPPRPKRPERRRLTMEEVARLESLDLPPGRLRRTRDAFLLSLYLCGLRFGDLCCLKVRNLEGDRIRFRMNKTGRPHTVPVPERARRLLEPYLEGKDPEDFILPLLQRGDDRDPFHLRRRISSNNTLANVDLKELARLARLERPDTLTFHVSRHTFADLARRGGDVFAVSKALGHQRLEVTERYLASFDEEAVDNLARTLWSE